MGGWLLILVAVAVGFAALGTPLGFEDNRLTGWLRVAAFVGLPLIALKLAAPRDWTAIFAQVGFREIRLMVGFALLNIIVSGAIGVLVKMFGTVASNAAVASAADLDGGGVVNFFAKVGVQLLGEELLTILPFLALLTLFYVRFGMSRKGAVIIAWLTSAVLFGLLHLPTYNWSLVQCLLVIVAGSCRPGPISTPRTSGSVRARTSSTTGP